MAEQVVPGFGVIAADFVVIRQTNQSYTFQENKTSLNVRNDLLSQAYYIRLDGGFFPEGDACDYCGSALVGGDSQGFLLELKGSHEKDAPEQLAKTLKRLNEHPDVSVHFHTTIVVSCGAALMPSEKFQKQQKSFLKQNHIPLKRLKSGSQQKLSVLL